MTRHDKIRRVQRPFLMIEAVLGVLVLLALIFGPKGQVNWFATIPLMLLPIVDAKRTVQLYKHQDEYNQVLILKSAALAFSGVMGGLAALGILNAAWADADFASGTMLGIFLAGYVIFLGAQWFWSRRDARE